MKPEGIELDFRFAASVVRCIATPRKRTIVKYLQVLLVRIGGISYGNLIVGTRTSHRDIRRPTLLQTKQKQLEEI